MVPVDLIFLHIVVPHTIKYFRPRRYAIELVHSFSKGLAKMLRLSSYLFGETRLDETIPSENVRIFAPRVLGFDTENGERDDTLSDGRYMRVPAQDKVSLPREIVATVAVNARGEALDERGARLMALQDAEAVKARRDPTKDYTTVYLPPRFTERIIGFFALSWIIGSFVSVAALVIPTILGRVLFKLLRDREVHDGYSFVVGLYLLRGCFYAAHVLDRMDKRRQRTHEEGPRGEYAPYIFKRSILWIGNVAWVVFWLGFVIPTLIGLVVECYISHPIRLLFTSNKTLHIKIFHVWASGLIYTKLMLQTRNARRETGMDTALKEVRPHSNHATKFVLIRISGERKRLEEAGCRIHHAGHHSSPWFGACNHASPAFRCCVRCPTNFPR